MAQESLNQRFSDEIEALKKNDEEAKTQMAKNHEEIMTLLTGQGVVLAPISETYKTATKLGKWLMAVVVFVSIVIGIVTGIQKILHR